MSYVPAIDARYFSLAFSGSTNDAPLQVLHNISFSIRPGEIVTIVGPSGCGKTTLLRVVAGLLGRENDNVTCDGLLNVFGMSPSEAKRKKYFSFTFQNPVLLPWRNVRQNVGLPLEIMNRGNAADNHLVDEMLSTVGIREFENAMPSEISGGMKQRANLARALVQEPKILLMDEPFGSLDEITRERLNFELLRIHRIRKPTILFITHSLSEAALLGDRVFVLSRRPTTVREIIPVELEQERTEKTLLSSEYLELVHKIREIFAREASGI